MRKHFGLVYRGIRGFLRSLIEKIPAVPRSFKREVIGYAVSGTEIECLVQGDGPIRVAIVAAMHGNEVGSVKFAHDMCVWISAHEQAYPHLTFYIVPVLNPDGYAIARRHPQYFGGGRVGRFNTRGVDLNRNFPTKSFESRSWWRYGKDYAEREEVYCGEYGGSEPEVQALVHLVVSKRISVLWAVHNAGRDIMGNDVSISQELVRLFNEATGFLIRKSGDWKQLGQTGTAAEWCDEQGIAYMEVEGSSRWNSDWVEQQPGVEVVLRKLNCIKTPTLRLQK